MASFHAADNYSNQIRLKEKKFLQSFAALALKEQNNTKGKRTSRQKSQKRPPAKPPFYFPKPRNILIQATYQQRRQSLERQYRRR